ncbi:sugar phosphate isomerase/epimerase family protein [Microbacterium lacus]|uniref:Xylose isomerase-like TIM barrel domain-containing protein n=1 Tax=Microbacterium lacus TaxID=415217 RepID=A0ABN2G360_9MICO
MNTISVSSYSLREQLGPIALAYIDAEGNDQVFRQDFPDVMRIADVPTRAAADLGVSAVETVAFQFSGIDDPEIDRFAANARAAGLELLNAAVDVGDLLGQDAGRRASDIAELTRWIDRFADAGFRFVRVNPGSPFSASHGDVPPAHLVAALRKLGEHASSRGIRLLVENHGGPSSDPAWMLALLDAVGRERLGLLLDLGNFDALMGPLMATMFAPPGSAPADPFADLDLTSLYEGIDALAHRAELVHVKIHVVGPDGAVGPVDLDRALGILAAHGYTGPLTVEYEGAGGDPWVNTGRVVERTAAFAV